MNTLLQYIKSTFNNKVNIDAKQYSSNCQLQLLKKSQYNVYITPIYFSNLKSKQNKYTEYVKLAMTEWSNALGNKIKFKIIDTPQNVDIKVYWSKSTRNAAGMQYTEVNSSIKTLCISIGITDIDYKPFNENEVYRIILHEFGHIFGLGHSPNKNDVMYKNWLNPDKLSSDDKLVLKLIYEIGNGKTYRESENYINEYIQKFLNPINTQINTDKNLLNDLCDISNIKKYILFQQNKFLKLS